MTAESPSDILAATALEEAEAGALVGAVDMLEFASQVLQLRATDFGVWWHREIFEAIRWVVAKTGNTSVMAVRQRLLSKGQAESAGRLMQLWVSDHCTTFAHLAADLETIRAASLRRSVQLGIRELERLLCDPDSTRDTLAMQLTSIMATCVLETGASEPKHISNLLEEYATRRQELEALQAAGQDTSDLEGLPSGLEDVDELFRSVRGAVIVVAGRPKMGKSVMGLQWAWHWSQFGPVFMWSGEMDADQICHRLISHHEQRPAKDVAKGTIEDLADYARSHGRNLHLDTDRKMSPAKLVARIEAFRARHGLRAIVIDYLGLLCGNDYKEVSNAVRLLNQHAGHWKVPILLLCQLSRKNEDRIGNNEPRPADLRDSGQIEQEAHTVCLLHRPGYYDKSKDQGLAILDVALNRSGPSGKVELLWVPQLSSFQTRRRIVPNFPTIFESPEFEEIDLL